jgi:succinate dehydrogenase / fumarate reductase membrane anchor subunit
MSVGESATPLGRVRGLGPSGDGGEHWIAERVSSIALLLLGAWLIAALMMLPALDRATLVEWLREPSGAIPMTLFVVTSYLHGLDGLKVVVDDYVHDSAYNFALNTLLFFLAVGGAGLALFALARIAFGGQA